MTGVKTAVTLPRMGVLNSDSRILITGGAGFLARGIFRYLEQTESPARVTVYSRDEHKQHELRARYPHARTVLGDVRDIDRLRTVMAGHDVVIHAAAVKHIPEAERDVSQAIAVNVTGSYNVALAAIQSGVSNVVGISTDKVSSPRNAYGMTKALMERTFQEFARLAPDVRFTTVRYGNVVSSSGSVIPLFREQIKNDNCVKLTSMSMTRFWISVFDAIMLIDAALTDSNHNGGVYVNHCAAMTIHDVAQTVWRMMGNSGNVPTRVIGVRPGEKLHECLYDGYEAPYRLDTQWADTTVIPPVLQLVGEPPRFNAHEYVSSHPVRWLMHEEMHELIDDSTTV